MASKRRATSPVRPPPAKKREVVKPENGEDETPHEERSGVVDRRFYPREMTNERCAKYNDGSIPRPIALLNAALLDTRARRRQISPGKSVVHWFKRDLRLMDNHALSLASRKAKDHGIPLVCMYIVSPEDFEAHNTSAARVDFDLRNLELMKQDLAELDIPLYVETVEKRKDAIPQLLANFKDWGAKHVYCNMEYEVDELRRETKLVMQCLKAEIAFEVVQDDVVVEPGKLASGAGKQYSVYSPWFKSWVKYVHEHPHVLKEHLSPTANPSTARDTFSAIFDASIPPAPACKALSTEDRERLTSLFPAGEHEALTRLNTFLSTSKAQNYARARNLPATPGTSVLSPHFSAGTLSTRTAVRLALATTTKSLPALESSHPGLRTWISEVAWRDFYKHVLAHWPYVCMAKPFKYEYTNINWEYNDAHFEAWAAGKTGYPIVDAAMRQCNTMAWMHNRCRMIVASFLAKDLLLDWRLGEKYFMLHLIDGDFASNNGGWGFAASTGVDPQPYFRVFNPLLQSEKFDAEGEYIRKWVPELKDVVGKAIHDPYGRGAGKVAEKAGYPKPIVEHKMARERALARYKEGIGRETANVGGGVHN
ncbi:hypothetical protein B0A48_00391 [Cryoendolithus antarcticus]|uniref:Photolyase/cryptochrome alpha/beta domain-containing protein n=1 Tax=Cryoendolithus antarcticus TaxID=1507870 RepID=A0A1V8TUI9_9PEZI|nr:hypothetical protein B0A48_00391 [Cryoendolithus antarcticus]